MHVHGPCSTKQFLSQNSYQRGHTHTHTHTQLLIRCREDDYILHHAVQHTMGCEDFVAPLEKLRLGEAAATKPSVPEVAATATLSAFFFLLEPRPPCEDEEEEEPHPPLEPRPPPPPLDPRPLPPLLPHPLPVAADFGFSFTRLPYSYISV